MARNERKSQREERKITQYFQRVKNNGKNGYGRVVKAFKRRPLMSFFVTLGILLLLIILANILGTPRNQNTVQTPVAKKVNVYHIGSSPKISLPAKIEKSGVIKIVAQTAGIVQSIPVTEGNSVDHGTTLVNLSTNYQGGDVAGVQAQIAQAQYNNVKDTFTIQKSLIKTQRQIATQSAQNTENLRQISLQSANDTQVLINNNQDVFNTINQSLNNYVATNSGGINDSVILQTRQLENQLEAGQNQLVSALRQAQYQTNTANPPSILNNLQRDSTLKQLEIQEKTLELSQEVSGLQVNLAYLNESLMHPASPVNGTVERVYVSVGQAVNPGTPLVTITGNDPDVTAVVSVPNQVAQSVSRIESTTIQIGNQQFTTVPRYVSQEATDGQLYTILYSIPQEYQKAVTNAGYVTAEIPIGLPDTGKTIPFIPLDSIYQTQDSAYVYVIHNKQAESKQVVLGTVYGRFIEITSGLADGDQVILDRNVIAGDKVE